MSINLELHENFDGTLDGRYKQGNKPASGLATWSNNFAYAGAFRVPISTGTGSLRYSYGVIGPSATSGQFYMSTDSTSASARGIAELTIPALSTSTSIGDLNTASVVQDRLDVFATPDGNPQLNDRVSGIYPHNGKLLVNLVEFYDAAANNTKFTARVESPNDFANTTLSGQYEIQNHYKAAGWFSPVPAEWQSQLGYSHIVGNSHNWSIIGRASVGPSAYGINLDHLTAATPVEPVPTEAFQSYDLAAGQQLQQQINPVWDLHNTLDRDAIPIVPQGNDVWTHLSRAGYGFIIPNTRTYCVVGSSAGHEDGIGYKITQDNANVCSGYCPPDPTDWSFYYWLFDVNDWLDVKNGSKQPYEIAPYEYGPFNTPFELFRGATVGSTGLEVRGGMFDPSIGRLYISVGHNDDSNQFNPVPIVYAYDIIGV